VFYGFEGHLCAAYCVYYWGGLWLVTVILHFWGRLHACVVAVLRPEERLEGGVSVVAVEGLRAKPCEVRMALSKKHVYCEPANQHVNAPSARVTEGVPINNTLSLCGCRQQNFDFPSALLASKFVPRRVRALTRTHTCAHQHLRLSALNNLGAPPCPAHVHIHSHKV